MPHRQFDGAGRETTQSVDLKKLLDTGSVQYNLAVFPGDRITVPRRESCMSSAR